MRTCSSCLRVFKPSSRHKKCPACISQDRKIPCPLCGNLMQPSSQICGNCAVTASSREENHNWKGGRTSWYTQAIEFLGGCCVVCGSTEQLQCDHIDPKTKLFNISLICHDPEITLEEFWLEVEKCQLLCQPHHSDKSRIDGSHVMKLRELDVKYIRGLSALGHSTKDIAQEFGVSYSLIRKILTGKRWAWVE